MNINDLRFPHGALRLRVSEVDRRQNHISQVEPNHPLLPIALDCLKDDDRERPSAQQLCERVAALKETANYHERENYNNGRDGESEQIQSLQENLEKKDSIINQKDAIIVEKEQQLRECMEEQTEHIQQLEREMLQLEIERNQALQEKDCIAQN